MFLIVLSPAALICSPTTTTRGQFHQPYDAERKCPSSHSSVPVGAVQFHQQNYTQLHHYAQLENTLNLYAVRSTPCASKIGVNLLAQKLCVKCWWDWAQTLLKKTLFFNVNSFHLIHQKCKNEKVCFSLFQVEIILRKEICHRKTVSN